MKFLQQWHVSLQPYNSRAPEMWSLISNSIDFEGKSVLDLGCGYGDMLIMAQYAKAKKIKGVDKNSRIVSKTRDRINKKFRNHEIILSIDNIENMKFDNWDAIICFSVLPYLQDPDDILQKIKFHSETAFIETQYYGEPYCLENIRNDKDMREWLKSFGWESVTNLGYTDVEIRNTQRTIWRCNNVDR